MEVRDGGKINATLLSHVTQGYSGQTMESVTTSSNTILIKLRHTRYYASIVTLLKFTVTSSKVITAILI